MTEDMQQPREFKVSWEEFHRNARALAWRLSEHGPFKGIAAVTRGGLVPAAIVAWELDLRLLETVCILSYEDNKTQGETKILKQPSVAGDGAGWLIVDDLVDTGSTARLVRAMMPKAHFASVYAKPAGRDSVDSFIMEVSQNTWIIFPWETEQTA